MYWDAPGPRAAPWAVGQKRPAEVWPRGLAFPPLGMGSAGKTLNRHNKDDACSKDNKTIDIV